MRPYARFLLVWLLVSLPTAYAIPGNHFWGFWAHKFINRMAVYRLPPELSPFFKAHIAFISENAVNPDRRRYAVVGEAERHFIDLDAYPGDTLPETWPEAVNRYGEESLRKHGIAPWYLQKHLYLLTEAFREKKTDRIIRLATDLGHYVADIHVPLHTTRNYNGQLSGQDGIHAFWESRLPEKYANEYEFWVGPVAYLPNTTETLWATVRHTHAACDSVLSFERKIYTSLPEGRRYAYEMRNQVLVKLQSAEFTDAYHKMLDGQVERQMRSAIRLIGDFWYTCWVNAGQPVLDTTADSPAPEPTPPMPADTLPHTRPDVDR